MSRAAALKDPRANDYARDLKDPQPNPQPKPIALPDLKRLQHEQDLWAFRDYVTAMAERPSQDAVLRIAEWAKSNPSDKEANFWAIQSALEKWTSRPGMVDDLRQLAEAEYPPAVSTYGAMLFFGDGVKPDINRGISLLKRAVELGDAAAHFQLALAYLAERPELPRDIGKAEGLLKKALEMGFVRAFQQMARCSDMRAQPARAFEFARRGAEHGDVQMILLVTRLYIEVAKEPARALQTAERGALWGHASPSCQYAEMVEIELGGQKRDRPLCHRLLERAARNDHSLAVAILTAARVTGEFEVELDPQRGLAELESLSKSGSTQAKYQLGRILLLGLNVDKNMKRARALLEEAAKAGDNAAQQLLEAHSTRP
jgi:TPR repeat protein